jgi:hypothetical protein
LQIASRTIVRGDHMLTRKWPAHIRVYCAFCRLLSFSSWKRSDPNLNERTPAARSSSHAPPHLTVYSDRTDGLGARLIAVTWGKVVADYFGADLKFSWPAQPDAIHHATETADNIFCSEFIEKNILDRKFFDSTDGIPLHQFLGKYFPCAPRHLTKDLWIQAGRPGIYKRILWLTLGRDVFAKAFYGIAYSDNIKRALNSAHSAKIYSNAIALHLRSGDIVNGEFRKTDTYTGKVIPYRQACAFIAEQRAKGKQVVLFGQDDALCRSIARAYGALWAPDLRPEEMTGRAERAFFDVCLMSRCSRIVSGSSDFSELAAAIQARSRSNLKSYWSKSKAVEILITPAAPEVEAAASNLEIAFSYGAAARLIVRSDLTKWVQAVEYLDTASKLDSENPLYPFVKAAILYSKGHAADADASMESIHSGSTRNGISFLLSDKSAPVQRYMSLISSARDHSKWAALCLAFDRSTSSAERAQYAAKGLQLPLQNLELRKLLHSIQQSERPT